MKLRKTILAFCIVPVICVIAVRAQDQKQNSQQTGPSAPIPPLNSGPGGGYARPPAPAARGVSSPNDLQPSDPAQVTPDQNTLAGAEFFGVGSLEHTRNIFDPAISFSELGQTGLTQTGTSGQQGLTSTTLAGGSLRFDRSWDIFHITAIYNGGEEFITGPPSTHFQFHTLSFAEVADWGRWHILLRDDFTASTGAAFTGSGMGGPGLVAQNSSQLGGSLNGISQAFTPAETIQTGNVMMYVDAVVGQAEYSFSRRSAVTFSGSYGILHFAGPGFIDDAMVNAQAGYDYLLDPNNSVAILGSYGKIDYTGTADSTRNYTGALAYGRKITGRLAFQVNSGPQRIESINGRSGIGNFQLWFWAANSALTYTRRRSGVSLSFTRGLTAGSGVFLGAKSDIFTGLAHYQFTRYWTGTVSAGYALNDNLAPAGVASQRFDNWFIGGNLGRSVGRHAQVNFNYGLQRQNSPSVCPVASCGFSGYQQSFGMTVNWHLRPTGL